MVEVGHRMTAPIYSVKRKGIPAMNQPQGLYATIASLEASKVSQSHIIDDLSKDLAKHKRANRRAMDLLTTSLQALDAKDYHITNEMVERASDMLYSVNRKALCQCGDATCTCDCIPGNYPCEHGTAGAGCGS